ncbi:MAG: hypothetical protein RLZZ165_1068, partial [Bacteroidota bacterium]
MATTMAPEELEELRQAVWKKVQSKFGHLIQDSEVREELWTELAKLTAPTKKERAHITTLKDNLHPGEKYKNARPKQPRTKTLDHLTYFLCKKSYEEYRKFEPGVDAGGLRVVDQAFLDGELARGEEQRFSALDFYCHVVHVQWWGIAKDLGVVRGPLQQVKEHISSEMEGYSPIKAVLLGPGGIGKSTMARIIAAGLVHDFEVVWVESSEVGRLLDQKDWKPGYQRRRLYFLDNWNKVPVTEQQAIAMRWERMVREDPYAQIGFVLSSQDSDSLSTELAPAKTRFDLQVSEIELAGDNRVLVDRVLSLFEGDAFYSAAVARMKALVSGLDLRRSLPFHLCYFLIRALQEPELESAIPRGAMHSTDRAQAYFEAIVAAELDRLEGGGTNGQAVVKALGITARIWEKYRYRIFSSSFLDLLRRFGYTSAWGGEIKMDEVLRLGHLRFLVGEAELVTETGSWGNQILFNKDELALMAADRVCEMQDSAWQGVLRDLLVQGTEPILLRQIWKSEGNFLSKDECLQWMEDWMARDIPNHSYQSLLLLVSSPLELTPSQREGYWERIAGLRNRNFSYLAGGLKGLSLEFHRKWRDRILDRRFWPGGEIKTEVFPKMFATFSSAKEKEEAAEKFLEKEYWKPGKIPDQVVSVCLPMLAPARRIDIAGELMDLDYWKPGKIPDEVLSVCLRFLPPERQSVLAVKLMDLDYWKPGKIPHHVPSVCLPLLPPARQSVIAGELMNLDYWKPGKIPKEVVSVCLPFLPPERRREVAGDLMDLDYWKPGKIPEVVVSVCLPLLPPERRSVIAGELMDLDYWKPGKIPDAVVSVCLRFLPPEKRRMVAVEALVPDFSKHFPVEPALVAVVCRIMGDEVSEAAKVLQDWSGKWGIKQRLAL